MLCSLRASSYSSLYIEALCILTMLVSTFSLALQAIGIEKEQHRHHNDSKTQLSLDGWLEQATLKLLTVWRMRYR